MKEYNQRFFQDRDDRTRHAARRVLGLVLDALPPVRSAVDVGCGVGTWLSVLTERGVEDVVGAEGDWLDASLLQIDPDRFVRIDLRRPIPIDRTFDLAISLEVAEHVTPEQGDALVAKLTGMADFVLFSAAIPGQGGKHHVNEQWQSYWAERFAKAGFVALDLVRPAIWHEPDIAVWYRQNTLLYARAARLNDLRLPPGVRPVDPASVSVVHPELYTRRLLRAHSLGGGLKSALRAMTGTDKRRRTLQAAER